jgi:hypothetical protein
MMLRDWFPRTWCDVGKRGQILLVFGVLWVGVGFGTVTQPAPSAWANVPLLSTVSDGYAWILTGLLAVAYAFRPVRVTADAVAFVALYVMPAYRAGGYLLAWIDSLSPTMGGPGYPRGWLTSLLYLAMVAAVMICGTWPEPPRASTEGKQ